MEAPNLPYKDVPKTANEKALKDYYMSYLEDDDIIPESVVKQFRNDVLLMSQENTRYLGVR